jgi:hypothetical protein
MSAHLAAIDVTGRSSYTPPPLAVPLLELATLEACIETDFVGEPIMRKLVFLLCAAAVVGLIVTGAIRLQRTDDTITIQIDKERVATDARKVIDRGKAVLRKAEATIEETDSDSAGSI